MRVPVAAALSCLAALVATFAPADAFANVTIKDRSVNQPLVLDQNEDYVLHNVRVTGVTDVAALTLAGRINSVNLTNCVFSNVWSGLNGKAAAAEAQGAIVGQFSATDTAFEDAQHQLLCLREGAFGTVTLQRCKFRTSDSFLKKIYADDPWRTAPPTTEFANIDRLELLDNEYTNTVLVVHPSVKTLIFRGDLANVRLQSTSTHVIRLERGQDPATIAPDGTAVAITFPAPAEPDGETATASDPAAPAETEPAAAAALEPTQPAPTTTETATYSLVTPQEPPIAIKPHNTR
jgi:hypothetical protein